MRSFLTYQDDGKQIQSGVRSERLGIAYNTESVSIDALVGGDNLPFKELSVENLTRLTIKK